MKAFVDYEASGFNGDICKASRGDWQPAFSDH